MLPVLISEICLLIILVIMWFLSILSDKKQAQTLFQNILMMFLSASTTFLWVNNNHCPLCLSLQFVFTLLKIPNINGDKGTAEHSQFWWYSVTKLLLNFSSSAVTLHSFSNTFTRAVQPVLCCCCSLWSSSCGLSALLRNSSVRADRSQSVRRYM